MSSQASQSINSVNTQNRSQGPSVLRLFNTIINFDNQNILVFTGINSWSNSDGITNRDITEISSAKCLIILTNIYTRSIFLPNHDNLIKDPDYGIDIPIPGKKLVLYQQTQILKRNL